MSLTDPLYQWNYTSGTGAGNYKLFVPGVVVPLSTTVGINGKITFVEKAGMGPPSSTGAYELDPTLVDNFSAAWRTMNGLMIDVFCSAGLTLADKVGRQIIVGGWSGTPLVRIPSVSTKTFDALLFGRSHQLTSTVSNTASGYTGPMELRAIQASITGKKRLGRLTIRKHIGILALWSCRTDRCLLPDARLGLMALHNRLSKCVHKSVHLSRWAG